MRKVLALVRAGWLTRSSYRMGLVLSLGTLLFTILPMYYIGNGLQSVMAGSIRTEGTHYFGFLVLGTFAYLFVMAACSAIPEALQSGVSTGTLEVLLSTPTRVPTLLAGLTGYNFTWAGVQGVVVLLMGWILGAHVAWGRGLSSLAIIVLIVLAYLPVGLIAGAMVLAFRTPGPLPQLAMLASGLLGGVYYPTSKVPAIIRDVSEVLPLTYGLRALRRVFLDGLPLRAVASDLAILVGMTAVSLAVATVLFAAALRYARRTGTLAQY